jgi:hypothetical protein
MHGQTRINDYYLCDICLSVRVKQFCSHWKDSDEILYLNFFQKYVKTI